MKTSSAAAIWNDPDEERVYRVVLDSLHDQLLLFVRDGSWRKHADLALWLAPRVRPEIIVQRFLASGGTHEKKLSQKAEHGQALVLKDLTDALRRKKLLAVRTNEAGEQEVQATPLKDSRFDIDAEFEHLLPRAPDEVKRLEERLLVEKQRDPLVVWQGHRTLIDGHTRFRFLALLGRPVNVVEMAFPDRKAIIAWIYDTHYGRRSYAPEMKSYVRGKQYAAVKQQHGGARKAASPLGGNKKTADVVALQYRVSRNTVLRDAAFAEALDQVAELCGDEVRQQVLARAVLWTKRDVMRLAKLAPHEVEESVRVALATGKRPRVPARGSAEKPARQTVSLPLGQPLEQARVLRKLLGGKDLTRLHRAIAHCLKKRRRSPEHG